MSYDLFLEPDVHAQRHDLPGAIRQRIRRSIDALAQAPRPAESQLLDLTAIELPAMIEIRRIRIERWRIIYAIHETDQWVWVLGIRRRPPYNYNDLAELVRRLPPA